jgi:hypothetical protein
LLAILLASPQFRLAHGVLQLRRLHIDRIQPEPVFIDHSVDAIVARPPPRVEAAVVEFPVYRNVKRYGKNRRL